MAKAKITNWPNNMGLTVETPYVGTYEIMKPLVEGGVGENYRALYTPYGGDQYTKWGEGQTYMEAMVNAKTMCPRCLSVQVRKHSTNYGDYTCKDCDSHFTIMGHPAKKHIDTA